jgi:methionine sulfoxide reductase heme-binding subunit
MTAAQRAPSKAANTKSRFRPLGWLQPAILVGSLAPFGAIAYRAVTGRLGANPIATALNQLGLLTLIFLVACLACTPAKIVLRVGFPIRLRKTLGLLAFFSALSHFLVYAVVDQGLALRAILRDVTKRPFIAVGFVAFVLLIPLALTSTKESLQRLGFARWKRLHQLIYVTAVLAIIHFTMRVKADTREPFIWGAILAVLFLVRVFDGVRGKPKPHGRTPPGRVGGDRRTM